MIIRIETIKNQLTKLKDILEKFSKKSYEIIQTLKINLRIAKGRIGYREGTRTIGTDANSYI